MMGPRLFPCFLPPDFLSSVTAFPTGTPNDSEDCCWRPCPDGPAHGTHIDFRIPTIEQPSGRKTSNYFD